MLSKVFIGSCRFLSTRSSGVKTLFADERVQLSIIHDRDYDVSKPIPFPLVPYSLAFELHPIIPTFADETSGACFDRIWEWGLYGVGAKHADGVIYYNVAAHMNNWVGSKITLTSKDSIQYDLPDQELPVLAKHRADLAVLSLLNVNQSQQQALICFMLRYLKSLDPSITNNRPWHALSPAALTLMMVEQIYGKEYAGKIAGFFGESPQFIASLKGSSLQPFALAYAKKLTSLLPEFTA